MKKVFLSVLAAALLVSASASFAFKPLTVIFDQGHGQAFLANQEGELQLSDLGRLFYRQGYKVMFAPGNATPGMLGMADVFVISGPFVPYTKEEAGALYDFVDSGGRLVVMTHISSSLLELFGRLGVSSTNGAVIENEDVIEDSGKGFRVTRLSGHQLTEGLKGFSVYGVWGVGAVSVNAEAVAKTSPSAWEDHDGDGKKGEHERSGPFGMIVAGSIGKGRFVVFGDDTMFQNKFLRDENLTLAENLVKWLK